MTFAPNTIYRDLIRKVHPDLNPTMKDATQKTQTVNAIKNNPEALRRLAIAWGFIAPTANTTNNRPAYEHTTYSYNQYNTWTILTLGLRPDTNYLGRGVVVLVNIGGRQMKHNVIRTTKKCVVVDFFGVPKIVKMANILKRER